jgi:hypothetical protein
MFAQAVLASLAGCAASVGGLHVRDGVAGESQCHGSAWAKRAKRTNPPVRS